MSFVYKTLEKVVAIDLEQNAFKENLMHEDQFGFVKGRSTEHALSATVKEIEKGLHEKEFVVATLLDIKGAFDNIKSSAIIKAMKKQGVKQNVCYLTISTSQIEDALA
jgi:retron-type reverse transcriptase